MPRDTQNTSPAEPVDASVESNDTAPAPVTTGETVEPNTEVTLDSAPAPKPPHDPSTIIVEHNPDDPNSPTYQGEPRA